MQIEQPVKVADVMTGDVLTASPATPFKQLVELITARRVSAVPIVDLDGRVLGVVSEADLLLKEDRPAPPGRLHLPEARKSRAERVKSQGLIAADVMTMPAITISPAAPLHEAARLMHDRQVKRLVVADDAGKLVGIVSRGDVLRVFLRPDADIKRAVLEGLVERVLWLEHDKLETKVTDGVVTLSGRMDRRTDVELLARLVADIDGVVGVDNRLAYEWDDTKAVPATPPVQKVSGPALMW